MNARKEFINVFKICAKPETEEVEDDITWNLSLMSIVTLCKGRPIYDFQIEYGIPDKLWYEFCKGLWERFIDKIDLLPKAYSDVISGCLGFCNIVENTKPVCGDDPLEDLRK